jgi:hypothetical protein
MKTIFQFLPAIGLLFLLSCSGNGTANEKKTTQNAVTAQAKKAVTLKAEDYAGKLDELLTLEMAAQASGFEASKATKEHDNRASAIFGGEKKPPRECNYLWENGRTRAVTVGGNTINAPYKDKVGINSVSNTTLERFQRNYGVLTDEQKKAAAQKLEEEAAKHETAGTQAGQQMTEVGKSMVTNLQVEKVTGVGEDASWYSNSNEIKVFYGGLTFAIVVDISDDKSVNKAKSIALAQQIINEKLK